MLRFMGTLLAWMVHLYTASSAAFGLWAVVAIFRHDFQLAMGLMLVTLLIDATDGALARAIEVRRRIPWFDGRRLDDIVDYFTYVVIPACFLIEAGLLPHPAWAVVPVIASGYGFSRDDAKTSDHFFLGFPSYWNLIAIYLFLGQISPPVALGIVLILSLAIFLPLRFVYPSRTPTWRPLTLAVLSIWGIGLSWLVIEPDPSPLWIRVSLIGPLYYLLLSICLHLRRARIGAGLP